ncbi:unnamed protein product, partial [marine sediment metagenome]
VEDRVEEAKAEIGQMILDMADHAPPYEPVERAASLGGDSDDPILFEVAIFDPHIGMLSWGKEVGEAQDTDIAVNDFVAAGRHLLSFARLYNTERILIPLGNDLGHVNSYLPGGKGAVTRMGTPQDVDGRTARIFTSIRRACVSLIDEARLVAPVDVILVEGNHDPDEMFKLGEVLYAWYRNDPEVTITYSPRKRKFYNYGACTFM